LILLSAEMFSAGLLVLSSPGLAYDCIENGWHPAPNIISGNQTFSGGDVALNFNTFGGSGVEKADIMRVIRSLDIGGWKGKRSIFFLSVKRLKTGNPNSRIKEAKPF